MAHYLLSFTLIRLVLPICLTACVLFRQNLFSFLYFLLFLFSPWVKVPTFNSMKGATGIYLKIVILCSVLTCLAHFAFQIVLLAMPPYGHFLENCGMIEKILRHVGLVRLNDVTVINGFRILGPDILMLICSLSVYIISKRLNVQRHETPVPESEPSSTVILPKASRTLRRKRYRFFVIIGKYITLLSLGIAGVIQPSILNGIYFLTFLGSMTWWACYRDLRRAFSVVLHVIVLIAALHITAIFCMQLQYIQEIVTNKCNICRYLGLKPLVYTNCLDPGDVWYVDADWTYFINPAILFWLYYILSLEARLLFMPHEISVESNESSIIRGRCEQNRPIEVEIEDDESVGYRENMPLIRGVSPALKYHSTGHNAEVVGPPNMFQDPHGSVTITEGREDAIQLQPIGESDGEEARTGAFEIVLDCITLLIQLVNRSSYIGANLIMMAWSITHHSWLTFILLLWASLLWMFPNQRRAMLRSSPFLVLYAELLLLAQYIYGMDLNDAELPQEVQGVNLKQIGFEKPDGIACEPLLIKVAYTTMFWITLRQYMQEKFERRSTSALHDLAAPLQVTVNTATSGFGNQNESNKTYGCLETCFQQVKETMVKYFIWVVAIMLFGIGITGKRMTLFRIIYMALFLIFILVFQLSYRLWRKMMFTFWLTVIVYSMSILILVYTYQFDNFSEYWATYLHIPLTLQLDIGLERFDTTQLFARLLTPTAFLVMTVIQLHYFHKAFLEKSDIKTRAATAASARTSRSGAGSGRESSLQEEETDATSSKPEEETFKGTSLYRLRKLGVKCKHFIHEVIELLWQFFELHILKILLLSIMLLSAYDVCALHFVLLVLTVISLSFGDKFQTIVAHICSIGVSMLILAKMIYQIEYIEHDMTDVNCTETLPGNTTNPTGETLNFTANDMDWVGFHKSSEDLSLAELLKGYIGLILVAALRTVVNIRQKFVRHERGDSLLRPTIMFPNIKRSDADKDLVCCIKYLFNYGFYKFGLEACLMATVGLIGTRLDFYAVLYSFWLCLMFAMRRETVSKIWIFYQIFITVLLPVQYVLAVGLPPGLCLPYPWYTSVLLRRLQDWMFLPDPLHSPPAYKLVCDFVLLMMVCRQSVVFRIERQNLDINYPGGTNKDITKEVEDPNFVNPVPDHVSYVRSWLDLLKRFILRAFLWLSLAVVFLAGTNRVNIYSLGYLCGAFIFLWQGEDFYLRPVRMIVKWWNMLLGYNVAVIVIKTLLQIPGCIYVEDVQERACWAVQLFSIACIKRFGNNIEDDYMDSSECHVPREDIGIAWDGVCFGFLIMMRRIFCSYYFIHLVNETKAMTVLASRGAELIEELRQKRIREQQEEERQILEKIKRKMDRIKATQQKVQGGLKEPTSHYVEGGIIRQRSHPLSNRAAIRSGDYYMFEEFDDEDILDTDKDEESDDFDTQFDSDGRRATLGQILSAAMKTDLEQAADMALGSKTSEDAQSPLPRKKSSFFSAQSHVSPDQPPGPSQTGASQPGPSKPDAQELGEIDTIDKLEAVSAEEGDEKVIKTEALDGRRSPGSSLHSSEQKKKPASWWHTLWTYIKFAWALIEGAMETLIKYLNRFSRDYRYVIKVLAMEKKLLKENPRFGEGIRTGSGMIWQPLPSSHERQRTRIQQTESVSQHYGSIQSHGVPEISSADSKMYGSPWSGIEPPSVEEIDQQELKPSDQPPILRLILALWFAVISHSELVCYFMVFLQQVKSATILSLPLPLMVFLWGTLSVPRPTKTFWVTLIAYTEVIVVLKCMFQFELLPWNQLAVPESVPFFPPRILGIERKKHYAIYDLLLLLVAFFHRFMLKSLGIWKSSYADSEELGKGEEVYELLEDDDSQFIDHRRTGSDRTVATMDDRSSQSQTRPRDAYGSLQRRRGTNYDVVTTGGRKLAFLKGSSEEIVPREPGSRRATLIVVKTEEADPFQQLPQILLDAAYRYLDSVKDFFHQLLYPSLQVTADVYAYMFMCDFFNFMVVIIGFASFGAQQGDGGVSSYLEENKVPIPFLVMMILQFALIIIDRSLFLRKFILGKIVFQFFLVIGIHIWMFFVLPAVTERPFNATLPPQMWYMVKCFYLLLSAYQIRSGYPTRILRNFLCKKYNIINLCLFKCFMAVPFLFELRALMDWVWTDTSMTLFDWLKMEDIFANIFELKCGRRMESEYPQPRGQKKSPTSKYLMGGGFLFLIIAIIWFPLVFFALGNTVGEPSVPYEVSLEARIGTYQPIFKMSAQNTSIHKLQEKEYMQFLNVYKKERSAQTFLSSYNYDDIAVTILNRNSTSVWGISPSDQQRLIDEVSEESDIVLTLLWTVKRNTNDPSNSGEITDSKDWVIEGRVNNARNPVLDILLKMLKGEKGDYSVPLQNIFPKFLKVTNRGTATPVNQLMFGSSVERSYRSVSLKLYHGQFSDVQSTQQWWEMTENTSDSNSGLLERLPYADSNNLIMYTFNDKVFPRTLSFISAGGIIGLYTTMVLVVGRVIRGFVAGSSYKIMFTELPNVDRILQLCLDIYLVRESGELALEEDLFAKLVFLYRSPETLIKWTRPREEGEAEGDEAGDVRPPAIQ